MTGVNVSDKDPSENKMLTFVMDVWERFQAVRTVMTEGTYASMVLGIMKATELLDNFGHLR